MKIRERSLALLAAVLCAAPAARAQTPAPALPTAQLKPTTTVSMPIQIPRQTIPALTAITPKTVPPSRILSTAQLAELLSRPLPKLTLQPSGPPGKRALVVILENGGVRSNIDPSLRSALDVDIRTATCGNLEFELAANESIASLIGKIGNLIGSNVACLNPGAWRITTFNPLDWLNAEMDRALENTVKANTSLLNTQSYYDTIVVLEDADAKPANALASIRQLAPTHVLDIHVLTHGGSNYFVGYNGAIFNQASFFGPLQADRQAGKPLYLRAVYQMNCISGTLKDEWQALGAVAVNGTRQQFLNSMPHQYFHFMDRWLKSQGMSSASQGSFDDAALYTRPVYSIVGKGSRVDESLLTTAGSRPATTVQGSL